MLSLDCCSNVFQDRPQRVDRKVFCGIFADNMAKSPEQDLGDTPLSFTYNDLFDNANFSKAMERYNQLRYKPEPLTPEEETELDNLHAPLFRHLFDPI